MEVWGAEASPTEPTQHVEVGGRGSRRVPILALAAVAALVLAGILLDDGDDAATSGGPRDEHDGTTPAKSERSTTSTTRPRATTTSSTSTTLVLGPLLPSPIGASLLVTRQTDPWPFVDLDTGLRQDVRSGTPDPYSAVPVRGGIVVAGRGTTSFVYQPLPEGDPVELGEAGQVVASGLPDAVWLVSGAFDVGDDGGATAQLVGLDGQVRRTVSTSALTWPLGGTPEGLVFMAGGRTFLATEDGVHLLANGEALAVAGAFVVVLTCDDKASCIPVVVDSSTGRSHPLPDASVDYRYGETVIAADDGRVAVLQFGRATELVIYDAAGHLVGSGQVYVQGDLRWLPGGGGLVGLGSVGLGHVVADSNGELELVPFVGMEDAHGEQVLVIPR